MVSDITLLKELPAAIKASVAAYVGCVAGASTRVAYLNNLASAGFQEIEIVNEASAKNIYNNEIVHEFTENLGMSAEAINEVAESIVSMQIQAVKPN